MLVKCISISGNDIPEEEKFPGDSNETNYHPLKINENYHVFAIIFYEKRIDLLISPDNSYPIWVPLCLFKILDSSVEYDSHIKFIDDESELKWLKDNYGAKCIVGYKKITESSEHFIGLIDRNPSDLNFFFEYKKIVNDMVCR